MKEHIFFTFALLLCVLFTLTTQVYADIIYEPFPVFEMHTDRVLSMAFLDNQRLVSGGADGVLRVSAIRTTDGDLLWEKNLGFRIHTLAAPGDVPSILVHNNDGLWKDEWPPDGISIRSSDNGIWQDELRTADYGYSSNISTLAFNPLNDLLVSVGAYLCIWNVFGSEYTAINLENMRALLLTRASIVGGYRAVRFVRPWGMSSRGLPLRRRWSPDGRHLAIGIRHTYTGSRDSTIRICNVEITHTDHEDIRGVSLTLVSSLSGAEEGAFRLGKPVNSLAWSPDGKLLAAGFGPNSPAFIKVWNVENLNTPELEHTLPFEGDLLAWSPDGKSLAIGGDASYLGNSEVPGKAFLWSPGDQNWNLLPFEDYHAVPSVLSWAWSPDGTIPRRRLLGWHHSVMALRAETL